MYQNLPHNMTRLYIQMDVQTKEANQTQAAAEAVTAKELSLGSPGVCFDPTLALTTLQSRAE